MVCYAIRCDPLPDKLEEFDDFVTEKAKYFWLTQPGCKGFSVYGDKLMGWPERTIMIEVQDMSCLERILESENRKALRTEFMHLCSRTESQILDIIA